jgi:hypothetical protein
MMRYPSIPPTTAKTIATTATTIDAVSGGGGSKVAVGCGVAVWASQRPINE